MPPNKEIHGPPLPTPIRVNRLSYHLAAYQHKDYILKGFREGFSLHFEGPQCATMAKNTLSTMHYQEKIDEKLEYELKLGRISGPYQKPPFSNFKISPLSVRPKKEPNKIRLLHNLSYPYDSRAVNFNIPKKFSSVKYQSVLDAIKIVNNLGRGCFLAKSDIECAFRLIPLKPAEYNLTGFYWKGIWFDKVLPMGSASSCFIFEKFSDSLQFILAENYGIINTVKVIDDFLLCGKDEMECTNNLNIFTSLMADLGIPLAPNKTVLPCKKLEFLGIVLDTNNMTAHIPAEKVSNYAEEINTHLKTRVLSLKQLQSIIGKLNHTVQIIAPGRAFLRRLYDLTIGHTKPHAQIQLSEGAIQDLKLWKKFFTEYNSKPFLITPFQVVSTEINLSSDASHKGFSGTYGSHWVSGQWPEDWLQFSICILEIYPIFIILTMFAEKNG